MKRHYGYLLPAAALLVPGMMTQAAAATTRPVQSDISALPPALQYQAGVAYINGDGVSQDIERGRYWLHLAARQGVPLAQYNLGVMFYDGIGGEQSRYCAQWWLQRSYEQQEDGEVRIMAEQALSALEEDEARLQVPYALPVRADCDRLPDIAGADMAEPEEDGERLPLFYALMRRTAAVTERALAALRQVIRMPEALVLSREHHGQEAADMPRPSPAPETAERPETEISVPVQPETAGRALPDGQSGAVPAASPDLHESAEDRRVVDISDWERGGQPGMMAGQHRTAHVPAETEIPAVSPHSGQQPAVDSPAAHPETDEPDLAENHVPVVASPEDTALLPPVSGEQGHEDGGPAHKSVTMVPQTPLSPLPRPAPSPPDAPKTGADKKPVTGGNLRTAPGAHYTLQLAGAATPEGLYRSAGRHHLDSYLVYETRRDNRRWYVLVAGEYPTRQAAQRAVAGLPAEFRKNGAWVRSLRQVQSDLAQPAGG